MGVATAAILAGAGTVAGSLINKKANDNAMDAETARRNQTREEVTQDLKGMSDFNNELANMQKKGYMDSVEGKGIANTLMMNQRDQQKRLSDYSSLGNFTDEAKLAGLNNINKNTAAGLSSLAQNATAYRRNLLNMRQKGISDYVGQKWNAINQQNAITAGNTQALYAQNAQNFQGALGLTGTLADLAATGNWGDKK